jgi:hypothetical protein
VNPIRSLPIGWGCCFRWDEVPYITSTISYTVTLPPP